MGIHTCYRCNCNPGPFFVWTSSRRFDREKLIKDMNLKSKFARSQIKAGAPICFQCLKDLCKNVK